MAGSNDDPFADPFQESDPDLDFVSAGGGGGGGSLDMPSDDPTYLSSGLDGGAFDPYPTDGGTEFVSIGGTGPSEVPADDAAREAEAAIERPTTLRDQAGPGMTDRAMGAVTTAMFGGAAAGGQAPQARYLSKRKTKSSWESAMHNTGTLYLGAGVVGMSVGAVSGVRSAKNFRPRIVINSVLNSAGRSGARLANGAAVLAMFYTGFTLALDQAEFDGIPSRLGLRRQQAYTPMAATALSLLLFRSPQLLAGTPAQRIGAAITPLIGAAAVAGLASAAPYIGPNAPFRWG